MVYEADNLVEVGQGIGKHSFAVSGLNLDVTDGVAKVGRHEVGAELASDLLSIIVLLDHDWDIPDGPVVPVLESSLEPTVASPANVAPATLEEEHPAVNQESVGLQAEALKPSKDVEWKEGDVEDPNEDHGAYLAPPGEETHPDPINEPIDGCDSGKECPPGQRHNHDDVELPRNLENLHDDYEPSRQNDSLFLLRRLLLGFLSVDVAVDLKPEEIDAADFEPRLSIALGPHHLRHLVLVISPHGHSFFVLVQVALLEAVRDPADTILIDVGEDIIRVLLLVNTSRGTIRTSFFGFLSKEWMMRNLRRHKQRRS